MIVCGYNLMLRIFCIDLPTGKCSNWHLPRKRLRFCWSHRQGIGNGVRREIQSDKCSAPTCPRRRLRAIKWLRVLLSGVRSARLVSC